MKAGQIRTVRRLAALVALVGVLDAWPSAAAGEADVIRISPVVEAWHEAPPPGAVPGGPCSSPLGCPQLVPPLAYPAETLHVGLLLGTDTAHAFVDFDPAAVPESMEVTGGTLTIPVITDPFSGALQPEATRLIACPVTAPFGPASGGAADEEPTYDCSSSTSGRYDASAQPPVIRFDLTFVSDAVLGNGLALVPSTSARFARSTFRVVIPTVANAMDPQIVATLDVAEPTADDDEPEPPGASAGPGFGPTGPLPELPTVRVPNLPPSAIGTDIATQPVERPAALGPNSAVPPPVPISSPAGYMYPAVWLAPFAIVGLASLLSKSLTQPIVLPATTTGR